MWRVLAVSAVVACAPVVDAPAERARAADAADGDRLAATLGALPGALSAHATLHRAFRDPLATSAAMAPSASALVVIDDGVDRGVTLAAATALVRAAAPEVVAPTIVVELGAPRPVLASVGPFSVERRSRTPLVATLAVAFATIAGLAIALARRMR